MQTENRKVEQEKKMKQENKIDDQEKLLKQENFLGKEKCQEQVWDNEKAGIITEDDLKDFFAHDQFAASLGIKLLEAKPGYAVSELVIKERHLNAVKIVQGGVIFTLADFTFAAASNACGQIVVAAQGNITYFQAPRGKKLIAKATEISAQNRLVTYNVDIFDENNELIARFTGLGYKKKQYMWDCVDCLS